MRFPLLPAILMAGALVALPGQAQAETTVNAGARLSHDNNVNGSPDTPSRANQRGGSYRTLSASAVYYTPLDAAKSRYFIGQVGAMSSAYNKFDSLDSSLLVASAGLYLQLSPTWSGQVTGRGFIRDTQLADRDSDGGGGTLEIKKQLSATVWIKGVADYEDSAARLGTYSHTGQTAGVNLGYMPLKDTFINFGYSQNHRDFKNVAFKSSTQTVFVEVTQRVAKNWYVNGGYAAMDNDSNYAGTAYTNRIVSAGLSLGY